MSNDNSSDFEDINDDLLNININLTNEGEKNR